MRRDDVERALDALAAEVRAPSADAESTIARGRRRIRHRRTALVGTIAVLVAAVVSVGAITRGGHAARVATVAPTTTAISAPTSSTVNPAKHAPAKVTHPESAPTQIRPIPIVAPSAREAWLCSAPLQHWTRSGTTLTNVVVPTHRPMAPSYQYPLCSAVPGGNVWWLTATDDPQQMQLLRIRSAAQQDVVDFPRLPPATNVLTLMFVDTRHGWAVTAPSEGAQVGIALYATNDGGSTWRVIAHRPPPDLHFADADDGWAAGPSGDLLRTRNGGRSWAPVAVPTLRPQGFPVAVGPAFVSDDAIVAEGSAPTGSLTRPFFDVSTDNGRSWALRSAPSGVLFGTTAPGAFAATDADHWEFASGNVLWNTADGGRSWTQVAEFAGIDDITAIAFPTPSVAYVSATGAPPVSNSAVVLQTVDGGVSWTTVDQAAPLLPRNADFVNFPGGIVGCPTRPLAPLPPGSPPAGLVDAAKRYVEQGPNGWTPNYIGPVYAVGQDPNGSFGYLFAFQVGSCGPAAVADSWVVEMVGHSIDHGAAIPRAQLALAYAPSGWYVFGRYN